MDLQWEDRFRHVLNHMSAHGQRVGTDVLVLGEAILFMTETSYCLTVNWPTETGADRVTVYFYRGPRRVEFLHGTEDDFMEYCRMHAYDLPDQLI